MTLFLYSNLIQAFLRTLDFYFFQPPDVYLNIVFLATKTDHQVQLLIPQKRLKLYTRSPKLKPQCIVFSN